LVSLPTAASYEVSYMHRDVISHVIATKTLFLITASVDGHIKFWKKVEKGIELVKHYISHTARITSLAASLDGNLLASVSLDKSLKIYDIPTYDVILVEELAFEGGACVWVHPSSTLQPAIVICELQTPAMHLYSFQAENGLHRVQTFNLHAVPVTAIAYNHEHDYVISGAEDGSIEYWDVESGSLPDSSRLKFSRKIMTQLYHCQKNKMCITAIDIAPNCEMMALTAASPSSEASPHFTLLIWQIATGRIHRQLPLNMEQYRHHIADNAVSNSNSTADADTDTGADAASPSQALSITMDEIDFGRRVARERSALDHGNWRNISAPNACWDATSQFLFFGCMLGLCRWHLPSDTRHFSAVQDALRPWQVALIQGRPTGTISADPSLFCSSWRRERCFVLSRREPNQGSHGNSGNSGNSEKNERDRMNEKDVGGMMGEQSGGKGKKAGELAACSVGGSLGRRHGALPSLVTLHTSLGDIRFKLFPEHTPKTCENFVTHCQKGYYNNILFHRVIKGFMIQSGDPLGDGTGGESIWGGHFADEFHPTLRHDRAGVLAMANAGPGTNGSQFFVTTAPAPHLDDKHTVFGRVVKGMDVVHTIEMSEVGKRDRPVQDIRICSVTVREG
jgi:peptidylprolyl isomerase domain and WD repeat-containing protein 1